MPDSPSSVRPRVCQRNVKKHGDYYLHCLSDNITLSQHSFTIENVGGHKQAEC